ncbi:hypothetical protein C8R45DRAFT_381640 [Mycena sanguinolenta]|nr:hypothetical protein C8R45DRAFT_381640 [Mycena sanguinolenta]
MPSRLGMIRCHSCSRFRVHCVGKEASVSSLARCLPRPFHPPVSDSPCRGGAFCCVSGAVALQRRSTRIANPPSPLPSSTTPFPSFRFSPRSLASPTATAPRPPLPSHTHRIYLSSLSLSSSFSSPRNQRRDPSRPPNRLSALRRRLLSSVNFLRPPPLPFDPLNCLRIHLKSRARR